jgi:hypothetical protein
MNKKEVLKLIITIENFYNNPWTKRGLQQLKQAGIIGAEVTAESYLLEVVNSWHNVIKEYDFNKTMKQLEKFVVTSKFPPTVADLIEGQYRESRPYDIKLMPPIATEEELEENRKANEEFKKEHGVTLSEYHTKRIREEILGQRS